jgi:hypothetical protein
MTESRTHARLSPSGAERWVTCPGSVVLEAPFPDSSSEHADWGTAAHAVAEMCLRSARLDAGAYKGRRIDVSAHKTVECNDEMVETINTYLASINSRIGALQAAGAKSVEMHVEVAVPIDHITGEPGATGTADCVLIADFGDYLHLDVNDLKGGRGVAVAAIGNKQLAMYADGARQMFDLVGEFRTIAAVIHQPRVREEPAVWEMTAQELDDEITGIRTAAQRAALYLDSDTQLVDSDLQPGEKACRFCKAKATCPALQRTVQETIGAEFEDLTNGENQIVVNGDIPAATIAQSMAVLDLIESWCKAVRAEAERRLFAGEPVPGYKLVQGRKGSRAWGNPEEAEKALKGYRLKVEEMYDLKLISPTTAEKLAKAGTIGPRQWPKLQSLITQSEGSPSVAPESDKRPALVIKPVAEEFEDLTEGEDLV